MTVRRDRSWAALALAVLVPLLLGVERPKGLGDVGDVRTWSHPDYTRVVVELSRSVGQPVVVQLAADPGADRPDRLYVDLDGIWVGRQYKHGIAVRDGAPRYGLAANAGSIAASISSATARSELPP